jgi:hypothetical protein
LLFRLLGRPEADSGDHRYGPDSTRADLLQDARPDTQSVRVDVVHEGSEEIDGDAFARIAETDGGVEAREGELLECVAWGSAISQEREME